MHTPFVLADYISSFARSPLARFADATPWLLVGQVASIVRELLAELTPDEFVVAGDIALHRTAVVETGAVLKGPLILGARCFVAASAYLRAGNWVGPGCTVGPGVELKSSFVFADTKLAHFNFVGDSMIGAGVNLEAGSVICNCRNERSNKEVRVRVAGQLLGIGADKFGALVGDRTCIGANAVVAPGSLLVADSIVQRAQLIDQEQ